MLILLLHHLVALVLALVAVPGLLRARWTWRAPAVGVAVWQLLALTCWLSLIGSLLMLGLAPDHSSTVSMLAQLVTAGPAELTASRAAALVAAALVTMVPLGAAIARWLRTLRKRRRHRALLALVARDAPGLPGVLMVEHARMAAYCLPGRSPRLVLSSAALHRLSRPELMAVLAHERAHLRERHDLALWPFATLRRLCPGLPLVTSIFDTVAALLEMRADDLACRVQPRPALASALRRFADDALAPPAAGLSITGGRQGGESTGGVVTVADTDVAARRARIATPHRRLPLASRLLALGGAGLLAATPLSVLLWP